jgi:hypothetical protein
MNNGEDLLVQLIGDEEEYLWVTQPYRVELMPSATTMTVTTSIMRWIPFESLMEEKIRINKTNILTYMHVDDNISDKYLRTINEQIRKDEHQRQEAAEQRRQYVRSMLAMATANSSGNIH